MPDRMLAATVTAPAGFNSGGGSCSTFTDFPDNPGNVKDGDDSTFSKRGATVKGGPCTYTIQWVADLGAAYDIEAARIKWGTSGVNEIRLQYSTTGTSGPWTTEASIASGQTPGVDWEPTFSPVTARYWRLLWDDYRAGLSYYAYKQVHTWSLFDTEPPPPPAGIGVDIHDPEGGYLATLASVDNVTIRTEFNGPGSGRFTINKHDAQATAANIAKGNICRVTIPEIDPVQPIFDFILETGDFELVSSDEEGGETLTFGGPGTLVLLRQALIWHESNVIGSGWVHAAAGVWRFEDESTGYILRQMLQEAENRSPSPLPSTISINFGAVDDSDASPWPTFDGRYEVPIGSDVYTEMMALVEQGRMRVRMDPGFILRAYQVLGGDKTGEFGADTVRFEAGINIVDEVRRAINGRVDGTHALIQGSAGYATAVSPDYSTGPVVEVFVDQSGTANAGMLEDAGLAALELKGDAQEAIILRHLPGNDPENGLYYPGQAFTENGKYWPGDLITLHTGTGDFDYDEETFRVVAITIERNETGALDAFTVELGAPYPDPEHHVDNSRIISGGGGTGSGGGSGGSNLHTHPQYIRTDDLDASDIPYDNGSSGLTADDVQEAIDELAAGGVSGGGVKVTDLTAMEGFLIMSHHGDMNVTDGYPKSSLEAHRQACERGADWVDLDVRWSSDDVKHVFHDDSLTSLTTLSGSIGSNSAATIAAGHFDSGTGYDAGRHGSTIKVPTLDAVVEALFPTGCIFFFDNKSPSAATATELAQYCVDNDLVGRAFVAAYDTDEEDAIDAINPYLRSPAAGPEWTDLDDADDVHAYAPRMAFGRVLFDDYGIADEDAIVEHLISIGARGITSNDILASVEARRKYQYTATTLLVPAVSVEDETTWGITPAVGTDDEYARQDHTHGTPEEPTGGGAGEIVITSVPAGSPLVFADLVQNSEGTDLVYASAP